MQIDPRQARLVISGLALGNPYVGQGAYTYRLIVGLLRRAPAFTFRVVVPETFVLPEIPEAQLVRLPESGAPRNALLNGLFWSNRILRFAARLAPEIIFHSPSPITGIARAPRTVVTIHDCLYRTFTHYYGRSGIRRLSLLASERYAARSQLVLTQSEFSKRDLSDRTSIPAEKIRVLCPWVDERFRATPDSGGMLKLREKLRLPQRFWLYVGGYDYRKNVEFLIAAYAEVRRSIPVPPLVLAGKIPEQASRVLCDVIGALKREGLPADAVRLPGLISAADLPDLYSAASLLIYPSLMEGFGLPPAEAIAMGTPVLTSDNSSLPEVVANPDCLFDAKDRTALVEKLHFAANDERRFVAPFLEKFTESHGVERYLYLLQGSRAWGGNPS